MRKSDAEGMNLIIEPLTNKVEVRGYGDGKLIPLGTVKANLNVDCAMAEVIIYIVEDKVQGIPMIVGQPFIEKENIVLMKRGSTVRVFEENNNLMTMEMPELPPRKVNLWASQSIIIPPNHIGVVEVITEHKSQDIYIDAQHRPQCCIPRCVVSLEEKGQVQIPIINYSNCEIKVFEKVLPTS